MIPSEHRARGARAVGASRPGERGPFGQRPLDDALDEPPDEICDSAEWSRKLLQLSAPEDPAADDRIAAQIAEASRRREAARQRRQALNAARQRGLAQRHAAKLRRLAERDQQPAEPTAPRGPGTCACGRTPDPGICPTDHGPGIPAGGHCACIHDKPNNPTREGDQP